MLLSVVGMVIMLLYAQEKVYTFVLKNLNLNWKVIQRKKRPTMKMNLAKNVITMIV